MPDIVIGLMVINMTKQCFYCSYPNSDDATRCINCGMGLDVYWDGSGDKPVLVDERKRKDL